MKTEETKYSPSALFLAAGMGMPPGLYFKDEGGDTSEGAENTSEGTEDEGTEGEDPEGAEGTEGKGENPSGEQPYEFVYEGQTLALSKKELNQLLHLGVKSYLAESNTEDTEDPEETANTKKSKKTKGANVDEDRIGKLESAVQQISDMLKSNIDEQRNETRRSAIKNELNNILDSHQLTKANKGWRDVVTKASLAELSTNPDKKIADVVKDQISKLTGIDESDFTNYLMSKQKDKKATKSPKGGAAPAPESVKFSGEDILKGKVKKTLLKKHKETQRVKHLFS